MQQYFFLYYCIIFKFICRLNLSNNNLTTLPNSLLRHCLRLRHIYLDNNQLKTLHRCVLPRSRPSLQGTATSPSPMTPTHHMPTMINDGSDPLIKTKIRQLQINLGAGVISPFYTISFYGNPLECGECRLLWLTDVLLENDAANTEGDLESDGGGGGRRRGIRVWGMCGNVTAPPTSVIDRRVLQVIRRSCNMTLVDCTQ